MLEDFVTKQGSSQVEGILETKQNEFWSQDEGMLETKQERWGLEANPKSIQKEEATNGGSNK